MEGSFGLGSMLLESIDSLKLKYAICCYEWGWGLIMSDV